MVKPRPAVPLALVGAIVFLIVVLLALFLPVIPYHTECRAIYDERIRHSREPQVTPEWAAAIRNWAEIDGCGDCNRRGRVTLFYYLRELHQDQFGSRRS